MHNRILICTAALFGAVPALAGNSPISVYSGNNHCYQYVAIQTTWEKALDLALEAGNVGNCRNPHLATILSQGENDFVFNLALSTEPAQTGFWLGGSDKGEEGVWKWVTGPEFGQVFTYTNWAAGEPNDNFGEDHLTGGWLGNSWNDLPDDHVSNYVLGYMVEWSSNVPEPAAWAMMVAGFGLVGATARRRRRAVSA